MAGWFWRDAAKVRAEPLLFSIWQTCSLIPKWCLLIPKMCLLIPEKHEERDLFVDATVRARP